MYLETCQTSTKDRSSRPEGFCKKGVPRNLTKFTGKHPCLFSKVTDIRPTTLLKKETQAQVFYCEYCEISKNTFSYATPPVATSRKSFFSKKVNASKPLSIKKTNVWQGSKFASDRESFIKYVYKIFRETNISCSLIGARTCAYQEISNVCFLEAWYQENETFDRNPLIGLTI